MQRAKNFGQGFCPVNGIEITERRKHFQAETYPFAKAEVFKIVSQRFSGIGAFHVGGRIRRIGYDVLEASGRKRDIAAADIGAAVVQKIGKPIGGGALSRQRSQFLLKFESADADAELPETVSQAQ